MKSLTVEHQTLYSATDRAVRPPFSVSCRRCCSSPCCLLIGCILIFALIMFFSSCSHLTPESWVYIFCVHSHTHRQVWRKRTPALDVTSKKQVRHILARLRYLLIVKEEKLVGAKQIRKYLLHGWWNMFPAELVVGWECLQDASAWSVPVLRIHWFLLFLLHSFTKPSQCYSFFLFIFLSLTFCSVKKLQFLFLPWI